MRRGKPSKHSKKSIIIRNISVIRPERTGNAITQPNATVVIRGGSIDSIESAGTKTQITKDAMVIDGTKKWLLPGFVDTHIHFFQSGNPYTRPDILDLTNLVPYAKENARNHARLSVTLRTWLACGVTTVMDMGGPFWNFAVRGEARTRTDAPRVLVTGPLFSMIRDEPLELEDPPILKVSSLDDVETLARRQLARRPNYLKVWYVHSPQDNLKKQEAIVKGVGDRGHNAGILLAVHATELEVVKSALRAGADILVLSVFVPVDEEFLHLAK